MQGGAPSPVKSVVKPRQLKNGHVHVGDNGQDAHTTQKQGKAVVTDAG